MNKHSNRKIKVAIAQASAVFHDKRASLKKALEYVAKASQAGAKLVALGETWLPGYPAWLDYCPEAALWNHSPVKRVFAELRENSVVVPGPETAELARAAKRHGITVVIGINERVDSGPGNGTLYNSLLTFTPDGKLANHHRKLVPTFSERMVWGNGDGKGLQAVDTPIGRVGGLICWEHWMPLTRQAMHNSGETIHVAVWPNVHENHQIASRHYAFEGRCFVLAVGVIMPAKDLPGALKKPANLKPGDLVLRGGSAIIAPDGRYITEPLFGKEKLIVAEIDLREVDQERMTLDVAGHYSRPDVFSFAVNRERK